MSRNTPADARKLTRYDVSIIEVIIHRASIEAIGIFEANEQARDLWDECPDTFDSETLGRTDLIIADEVHS